MDPPTADQEKGPCMAKDGDQENEEVEREQEE